MWQVNPWRPHSSQILGFGLGSMGFTPIYDGLRTSWIMLIYDEILRTSREGIRDTQYMTFSNFVIDVILWWNFDDPWRKLTVIDHEIFCSATKSQRERSRNHSKKIAKKRLRKLPKRTNGNNTSKPWGTTPNHLYITKRFIQGQACRPIILPSHKISPWSSQASPIEILEKIGRENRKTKWARVPRDGCHPLTSWVIWRQPKV
jgi:hypothetical protein